MVPSQRTLRRILGAIWIIDGLLQLQPQMFTMNMINGVMIPMLQDQPPFIARNLLWITDITAQNLTTVNIVIAIVQVSIGVLLFAGIYLRAVIIFSAAWALMVWYGGEGMSMLLTGHASFLTGAPGAVLLYALIGFAVYPKRDVLSRLASKHYEGLLSRLQLRRIFAALWIFFGLLQLQPYWWQHGQISSMIRGMVGMGGANSSIIDPTLQTVGPQMASGELVTNVVLIVICFALGIGLAFGPDAWIHAVLLASIVFSLLVWWFAQALGGVLTGMATDFNSGLLLVMIAIACWPLTSASDQQEARVRQKGAQLHVNAT